ncbi:MAG: hypothetical protein MRERV_58c007 [Mycoplasmataceae bacterium RV_VA103A]|nr:MAG: hypothetical protein MRERV_58c007 [Mycoplasmataceae bacterium RV_VA103A]
MKSFLQAKQEFDKKYVSQKEFTSLLNSPNNNNYLLFASLKWGLVVGTTILIVLTGIRFLILTKQKNNNFNY